MERTFNVVVWLTLVLAPASGCRRQTDGPAPIQQTPQRVAIQVDSDGRLPDGCETAVQINLDELRSALPKGGLGLLSRLHAESALSILRSAGIEPATAFKSALFCRRSAGGKPAVLVRLFGDIPADFVAKLAESAKAQLATTNGAVVLRRDQTLVAQRRPGEVFFSSEEGLLGAMLHGNTKRYPFPPDSVYAMAMDRAGVAAFAGKTDLAKIAEAQPIQAIMFSVDRDRSTIVARLTVRAPAEASDLGVRISQMAAAWRRAGKIAVEPVVRLDGDETVVTFSLPGGTLEALLARMG